MLGNNTDDEPSTVTRTQNTAEQPSKGCSEDNAGKTEEGHEEGDNGVLC